MFSLIRRQSIFILVLACFSLLALTPAVLAHSTPAEQLPEQVIRQAYELARLSETLSYRSKVIQTTYPAPLITNAGRQPVEEVITLEGDVNLDTEEMDLTIWQGAAADPNRGMAMRVDGDRAYRRVGTGEWEEIDNFSGLFAPGADPLSWLEGIRNRISEQIEVTTCGH